MNGKRLWLAIATLAIVALGNAQGFPGGPPPGGPPGGPGFGGPGGRGGMMPDEMLVQRPDVQDDLGLTSDQKSKLSELRDQMREQMQSLFQDGQTDPQQGRQAMDSLRKKMSDSIKTVLTADEQTRLHQIRIQLAGVRAVTDPEMQKELGLSDDQKTQINSILEKERSAGDAIRSKEQSGEVDRDQAFQAMQNNQTVLKSMLSSVLTGAQKDKLKELGGKPFRATSQGFGPGGPGGFPGGPGGPPPGGPPPGGGPGGEGGGGG